MNYNQHFLIASVFNVKGDVNLLQSNPVKNGSMFLSYFIRSVRILQELVHAIYSLELGIERNGLAGNGNERK